MRPAHIGRFPRPRLKGTLAATPLLFPKKSPKKDQRNTKHMIIFSEDMDSSWQCVLDIVYRYNIPIYFY